jgi:hypothetical protein
LRISYVSSSSLSMPVTRSSICCQVAQMLMMASCRTWLPFGHPEVSYTCFAASFMRHLKISFRLGKRYPFFFSHSLPRKLMPLNNAPSLSFDKTYNIPFLESKHDLIWFFPYIMSCWSSVFWLSMVTKSFMVFKSTVNFPMLTNENLSWKSLAT